MSRLWAFLPLSGTRVRLPSAGGALALPGGTFSSQPPGGLLCKSETRLTARSDFYAGPSLQGDLLLPLSLTCYRSRGSLGSQPRAFSLHFWGLREQERSPALGEAFQGKPGLHTPEILGGRNCITNAGLTKEAEL